MKTTLRILSLTLAVLALTLCFAACGDKGGSASDLVFVSPNGVTLTIGSPAADAVTTLGDWVSMNSSDSCGGFSGKDYLYTYHGFRMSTTPAKDGQIICKVELTDDSVKTPEGLYIGMSRGVWQLMVMISACFPSSREPRRSSSPTASAALMVIISRSFS